ncbi:MAG: DUF2834 domain-containing protein [Moorea sp. SIO2B7]|nr:DUF2834 domain-containing protein [Moorena sp. SIO2B7]
MKLISLTPAIALTLFILFMLYIPFKNDAYKKKIWLFPAALSLLFLLFSVQTVTNGGMFGFWTEHTRNLWGNQIWLDLLLAFGIGWSFAVPEAKTLGMRPIPWLVLILSTGSVGLLAMLARLLYLRENSGELE